MDNGPLQQTGHPRRTAAKNELEWRSTDIITAARV